MNLSSFVEYGNEFRLIFPSNLRCASVQRPIRNSKLSLTIPLNIIVKPSSNKIATPAYKNDNPTSRDKRLSIHDPNSESIETYSGENETFFYGRNHQYKTTMSLAADPCKYYITDGIYDFSGTIDVCKGVIKSNNISRNFKRTGMNSYVFSSWKDTNKKQLNQAKSQTNIPKLNKYKMKFFIFNGFKRASDLGSKIVQETEKIAHEITRIFDQSKMPISVEYSGMLSFMKELEINGEKVLSSFKEAVSQIRYDPLHLRYPLGEADVVIYLENIDKQHSLNNRENNSWIQRQGQSYYGGSSSLSRSYAVVFASPEDSKYFVAKKISHEFGHLLGALHDKKEGFIMESRSCNGCENKPRQFSQESIQSIKKYISENKYVFGEASEIEERPIITLEAASKFVSKQRKHTYNDIVDTRLKGVAPEKMDFLYYLVISLGIYIICITIAIFYLN